MKKQQVFTAVELLFVGVWIFLAVGWIWNIVKIVQSGFDVITGIFVARCIGVFIPPLGAVLGFL